MAEKKLELVQGLGAWATMAMVVGHIIGTGVFLVPSAMTRATGSVGLVFLVWIVGGILSLFGALTIAELGAAMPKAGGAYVYLSRGLGPVWGFLFGWMNNLVGKPASIATIAAGFLIFLGFFFPAMRTPLFTLHLTIPFTSHSSEFVFTWAQPIAAAAIAFMSFVNYLGVRLAGRLQVVLTALKIGAILTVVILGFAYAGKRPPSEHPFFPPSFNVTLLTGFLTAMVGALWAYDGWMDLTFAGSEIIDPHKNIPRALVGGTVTVGVIYLLANAVYFRVLPMEAVAAAQNVASETVRAFAGARAAAWITAAMVLSAFTTLNSSVLTGSRVPFAMARDGLFFRITEGIHPRYLTPAGAIAFQAVIACLMVLTGKFEDLFEFFIFAQWIFYALTVASVYGLRRKEPDLPRPYRAWGYPVVPAVFVICAAALTVNSWHDQPVRSSIGLLLILAGLPFYYHWTKMGETTKGTMWSFEGRIGRRTFWTTFVSLFLGSLLVRLLLVALSSGSSEMQPWLVLIYVPALVVLTWFGLAMQVKRWHDLGYSGWMVLINFTIIAIPIVLIILGCVKGTEGPNKYGTAQTEKRREFSP